MWGVLSDERTGLSFKIAAGPRQRSHSRVPVPWDSWPYFTASYLRLPFSSLPTTRRATVKEFDPVSKGGGIRCAHCFEKKVKIKVILRPTVQSASLSWNKAPIWGLKPDLYYCQTVAGLSTWGALSVENIGFPFPYSSISSRHGPRTENTAPLLLRAYVRVPTWSLVSQFIGHKILLHAQLLLLLSYYAFQNLLHFCATTVHILINDRQFLLIYFVYNILALWVVRFSKW
jgi:hypothetical protein